MIDQTAHHLATWTPNGAPPETDPAAIVAWAARRFTGDNVVMTSSFGMEGVVLLDMVSGHVPDIRVLYIDTGFLFPETLQLRDKLMARFPRARFEPVHPLLTAEEQERHFGPELWKRDPDLCCKMRKVEPLDRRMKGVDVWFTAIRRGQSAARQSVKMVDWDWQYQLVKVCPMVTWSRPQIYEYVVAHNLPYNELHDRGYPTVGCTHCTRPVPGAKPWDYSRNGRWSDGAKSECGLHGYGI
jgi:phosphoadenosine phosphosulfate reductase